jgi:transcriptional regulator with XRE-family HTH domain
VEKRYPAQIKQLGNTIKTLREKESLTQLELADKIGVDIRTVQRIEAGNHAIGLNIVFAVAEAFNKHPSELLKDIIMMEK